ncbi:hypothetical protein H8B02_40875 [Bradyrhizobium sp. Pear77]|uniref:hypothetical protein n=1 Tax=Bradyrhizobium altum TaxID=1571202 RepID=UPI001E3ED532|nr:hypothetical protein [Bradyrhizobium altum]MCC8959538.1 hypothetical protein [Bradyrhizobium altum]
MPGFVKVNGHQVGLSNKEESSLSLDSFLALAGLAVGIAALVPIFKVRGVKLWITSVVIAVFLVGMSGALLYQRLIERRELDRLKDNITEQLNGNNPSTFEELYDHLNYAQFALTTRAISELIEDKKIRTDRLNLKSSAGKTFSFRVYNNPKYPIAESPITLSTDGPPAVGGDSSSASKGPQTNVNTQDACPSALPAYDSPGVEGGHTQAEICAPTFAFYKQKYPQCVIGLAVTESNNKDWLGHVSYQYHCAFTIRPK